MGFKPGDKVRLYANVDGNRVLGTRAVVLWDAGADWFRVRTVPDNRELVVTGKDMTLETEVAGDVEA